MSFLTDKFVVEGLTFDEVLLIPACYEVLPIFNRFVMIMHMGMIESHSRNGFITSETPNYSR